MPRKRTKPINRTCEFCQRPFESFSYRRRTCSDKCAHRLSAANSGCQVWRKEEDDVIETLAGSKPFKRICQAVQRLEEKNGWPIRSEASISSRIHQLGCHRLTIYDNYSIADLAKNLGVSTGVVRRWVNKLGLPCSRISSRRVAISNKKFKEWIASHPLEIKMHDINLEWLAWALGDDIIEVIQNAQPAPIKRSVPAKIERWKPDNPDDRTVYPSLTKAGKANFICKKSISRAVKQGQECAGYYWRLVS